MTEYKRIAIDTSKAVFTLHGVDQQDRPVLRVNIRRSQLLPFFKKLVPTSIAMEACGSAHHWARELTALGHAVCLIPPQYVKPYVRRGKNDRNDAEAINEAAARPNMHFVPVKSIAQQAQSMVLKVREILVGQRTQLVNALRGHGAEFGVVAAKGIRQVGPLLAAIEQEPAIPPEAKDMVSLLGQQIEALDTRIWEIDVKMAAMHKADKISQRLATIPGVGPITALTLAIEVDPGAFQSGRHLAAWAGLTPKEYSTGGRQRMGGISRAGHERLRALLVTGATSVIRAAIRSGNGLMTDWLRALLQRKPRKVAAVALANKMARVAWALMTRGGIYRRPAVAVGTVAA